MLKEKTYTHTSIADGNSRNATWQLNREGLASFWRYSVGCNALWSGLQRWWPYTVSRLYNQDAFQCTPPNRRPVAECLHCSFSFSPSSPLWRWMSLCILNIWVTVTVNETRWLSIEVFNKRILRQKSKVRWKETSWFHGEGGGGLLIVAGHNRKQEVWGWCSLPS